jgi:hypothetical protein
MSGVYLLEGKGKQPLPKPAPGDEKALTPDNVRETARMYLERIISNFPNSDFRKQAQAALTQLPPATPSGEGKQ